MTVGAWVILKPHGVVAGQVVRFFHVGDVKYATVRIDRAQIGIPVDELRVVKEG